LFAWAQGLVQEVRISLLLTSPRVWRAWQCKVANLLEVLQLVLGDGGGYRRSDWIAAQGISVAVRQSTRMGGLGSHRTARATKPTFHHDVAFSPLYGHLPVQRV